MDKYKVIAEKITYSLDGYIDDHNNRNFGDADGWLRHVRRGWEEFIEAHPDCLNMHEYLQHQQAKVEELQKRVDLAILGINGVMRWIDEDAIDDADFIRGGVLSALRRLEQALKGEGQ